MIKRKKFGLIWRDILKVMNFLILRDFFRFFLNFSEFLMNFKDFTELKIDFSYILKCACDMARSGASDHVAINSQSGRRCGSVRRV